LTAAESLLHGTNALYPVSGFFVGVLVGLTGVGGGSLMTPLLVLLFGIHPATAVGTDLLYASITKTAGTLTHGYNQTIDWRVVGLLACGSLPATAVTIYLLSSYAMPDGATSSLITTVLAFALILTGISLVFRKQIQKFFATQFKKPRKSQAAILTVVLGAVLGVLVSLSSIGAGAIGATVLLILYPKFPMARIVGTDIAHAVPLTLIAGAGHWYVGNVDTGILLLLLLGSLPGVVLGSHLGVRVPEALLRAIMAVLMFVMGGRLLH
jgi:uncharacterized membrane protein YfcA